MDAPRYAEFRVKLSRSPLPDTREENSHGKAQLASLREITSLVAKQRNGTRPRLSFVTIITRTARWTRFHARSRATRNSLEKNRTRVSFATIDARFRSRLRFANIASTVSALSGFFLRNIVSTASCENAYTHTYNIIHRRISTPKFNFLHLRFDPSLHNNTL